MVKFMRTHILLITWIMVICFAATMFSGTFYFKDLLFSKHENKNKNHNLASEIATIDNVVINKDTYNNILNKNIYYNYDLTKRNLEPDQLESLKLQAFLKAANDSLFVEEAKKNHVTITGADLDNAIQSILKAYNIKNKNELKKVLKDNQVNYSDFISHLKDELLAKKFVNLVLLKDVQVSNQDIENSQFKLHLRHLLLKVPNNTTENQVLVKIKNIKTQIDQGLSFTEAIKKYSADDRHKNGDLGWISVNETPLAIEKVAYSLPINGISGPTKTALGYHLIQLLDKRMIPVKDFNLEKRRSELFEAKKSQVVSSFLDEKFNNLKIQDAHLSAIFAKQEGNYQKALISYQNLIAENPENPFPDYYIAELLIKTDPKNPQISEELNKASIKVELNPSLDFASLHILLGDQAKKNNAPAIAAKEYQKAFELGEKNIYILTRLKTIYKDNKKEYGKIENLLKNLITRESTVKE